MGESCFISEKQSFSLYNIMRDDQVENEVKGAFGRGENAEPGNSKSI